MIGQLPMSNLAPLDYRYALDAAIAIFGGTAQTLIQCSVPALSAEINQRFPDYEATTSRQCLWVEPLVADWQTKLAHINTATEQGTKLIIIASQPLARLLPERRTWPGAPLGMRWNGLSQLHQALKQQRFQPQQRYGIHTVTSIIYHTLSRQWERFGRPDVADRVHYAARLHYCTQSPLRRLATVGLEVWTFS